MQLKSLLELEKRARTSSPLFPGCGAAMATATCFQLKEKIDLTETEEKIFYRLSKNVDHFNLQTQLRVAGGWARDKCSKGNMSNDNEEKEDWDYKFIMLFYGIKKFRLRK
ncbi:hypothetical protein PTKIN_Ptkin15bG0120100 [Pterospermum kingtungense]